MPGVPFLVSRQQDSLSAVDAAARRKKRLRDLLPIATVSWGRKKLGRVRWWVAGGLLVLITISSPILAQDRVRRAAPDLRTWANVMEMFRLDDGYYPEASSIQILSEEARRRGYWDAPAVAGPAGQPYRVTSSHSEFRIVSWDGLAVESRADDSLPELQQSAISRDLPSSAVRNYSTEDAIPLVPDTPGTILTVSKSGNDVTLSWSGSGTIFAGARAADGPFTQTTTLFTGLGASPFVYASAVTNSRQLEFFDVTDETESNRGGNWNGGVLPPQPPMIDAGNPSTNIGSLFIGSTGTIVGGGFSAVPGNNSVCFNGGVCTQATTATSSQIQFITPPGALTGGITATVANRTSESKSGTVTLEDPASGWLIRTIGFSAKDKSFWMTGSSSGVNSVYRIYNDSGTNKWLREDRGGGISGNLLYCGTKTGRTGRLFCVPGAATSGNNQTYVAETSPPSNLASCVSLFVGGNNNVRGVAVDPNPGAVPGRDVYYVAHAVDEVSTYLVRKIVADCTGTADADYGNHNWFGSWNAIVGMAVDPVTGDLYIAAKTEIYKIAPDETITLVKGGFTSVNGIDVSRNGSSDPGVLLIADGGVTNTVKALALDNTSATPMTVATASTLRASSFGALVSGGPWLASNVNRTVVVNNNGNSGAVDPIRPDPLVDVTPAGPFEVRISSPTEQMPNGQSRMRPSTSGDSSFSQAFTQLQYRDGMSRFTCASVGDPGPGAPQYDAAPGTPANCNKPRTFASGNCDNTTDTTVGGPGSFVEGGNPLQSCKTCGGANSPCRWDFRITNRYGGDNYKVYFAFDASSTEFAATSDIYTAWKHVHLERERMCSHGGLLFADYGATGECGGAGQPPCCGAGGQPPCDQLLVFDSANISQGDTLVVFDDQRKFEDVAYTRMVTAMPVNNGNGSTTVTLDSALPHNVLASNRALPSGTTPLFSNGHAGGACAPSYGFDEADVSGFDESYGEAFISYHVPTYGLNGSGTVPRYRPVDFVTNVCVPSRFSNIWFQNYVSGTTFSCPDGVNANGCRENNYVHVLGAGHSASGNNGETQSDFNTSYLYNEDIMLTCNGATGGCNADKLAKTDRYTARHELAHQFRVNSCSADGHDLTPGRNAWCGSSGGTCVNPLYLIEWCPMHVGAAPTDNDMRADGIEHFCPQDLILGDPNCGGSPRDGAMRTVEDPQ